MNSAKKVERILLDKIVARGHPNVLGTHRTTIEITTENFLTSNGNCIIGVMSSKSVNDYSSKLKESIQNGNRIEIEMIAGPFREVISGIGHKDLALSNEISMVFRLSEFISDRTAIIGCSKSSIELNRNFIKYLKNPSNKLLVHFYQLNKNE
jgi:hypothetical protein